MSSIVVRSGDTLSRIARDHGTTVEELARANGLEDPNRIRAGQVLELPDAFADAPVAPVALNVPDAAAARIEAYAREHGLGEPIDNGGGVAPHDWAGIGLVQDFPGAMVVDGPLGPHAVRNDFHRHYLEGDTHLQLGAPLDDEHWDGDVVVQHFERGVMRWSPTSGTSVEVNGVPVVQPQPPQPDQPQRPGRVDTGNFLGGNYTDLGRIDGQEAMPDPLTAEGARALREAAARDLDRLRAQGIDHVRVWAQHPNGLTDPAAIAARIRFLAEEAQARGMTLTVDLFDNYAVGGRNVDNYRRLNMDVLIDEVVGGSAHLDNIQWSLGNEIGDPDRPLEFAGWYEETAAKIREAGGDGTVISAQFVPGSVNHPWANPVYAEAAQRIIAASDVVSIHAYPEGAPGSEPWMSGIEQRSTEWWAAATRDAGKTFTIGEFGLRSDLRTPENIGGWLRYYEDVLGADHVSLWQFMKDDVGHVDDISWDLITGNHTHLDVLQEGGWLGREPH